MSDYPRCRGCGRILEGSAYHFGGKAKIPGTNRYAKICYYGGWVCSYTCDVRACLSLEQTMPGHAGQTRVGPQAREFIENNWPRD